VNFADTPAAPPISVLALPGRWAKATLLHHSQGETLDLRRHTCCDVRASGSSGPDAWILLIPTASDPACSLRRPLFIGWHRYSVRTKRWLFSAMTKTSHPGLGRAAQKASTAAFAMIGHSRSANYFMASSIRRLTLASRDLPNKRSMTPNAHQHRLRYCMEVQVDGDKRRVRRSRPHRVCRRRRRRL
jgi:hypothetical protein